VIETFCQQDFGHKNIGAWDALELFCAESSPMTRSSATSVVESDAMQRKALLLE